MKFTETKPRKAKYGFRTSISIVEIMQMGDFAKSIFGTNDYSGKDYWFEIPSSYTSGIHVNVYINDEVLYEKFKAVNDAN